MGLWGLLGMFVKGGVMGQIGRFMIGLFCIIFYCILIILSVFQNDWCWSSFIDFYGFYGVGHHL